MRYLYTTLLVILSTIAFAQPAAPKGGIQNLPKTRMLFIYDASNSMFGTWGGQTKMDVARRTLIQLIDSLDKIPNMEMALRVYGHQSPVPPQDCSDSKLEVPFAPSNARLIKQKLNWIEPKGTTPIARSLEMAGSDFPSDETARNIIILITDGIEACDGDPCAVSAELQKRGIMLRPFIIGVGLEGDFLKAFGCVGKVFNATEEKQLKQVLSVAISQALNSTTAQVNLLDSNNKPTETNTTMTFYDKLSGKVKYDFVHTINAKGVPDTLVLDPLLTYRIQVHTIPPVYIENAEMVPGKHTIFAVSAPQGYLMVKRPSGNEYSKLQYIIRKAGSCDILNIQTVDKPDKYICGKYDVDILTLPPITVKNVAVSQSQTTSLSIPQPGMVNLLKSSPGYGGIYQDVDNKLKFVTNLDPSNAGTESYLLQPGKYVVVFRPKNANLTGYTIERKFNINSGGAEHIKLN